jgi:hypothetical protein
MNKIVLTEEDFILFMSNDMTYNDIKFSHRDLLGLITGEIVEINNNMIILQDIGCNKIFDILNKYKIIK